MTILGAGPIQQTADPALGLLEHLIFPWPQLPGSSGNASEAVQSEAIPIPAPQALALFLAYAQKRNLHRLLFPEKIVLSYSIHHTSES